MLAAAHQEMIHGALGDSAVPAFGFPGFQDALLAPELSGPQGNPQPVRGFTGGEKCVLTRLFRHGRTVSNVRTSYQILALMLKSEKIQFNDFGGVPVPTRYTGTRAGTATGLLHAMCQVPGNMVRRNRRVKG